MNYLFVALLALMPLLASARVPSGYKPGNPYYVWPNSTIQEAIDSVAAVRAEVDLRIATGTYAEHLVVPPTVHTLRMRPMQDHDHVVILGADHDFTHLKSFEIIGLYWQMPKRTFFRVDLSDQFEDESTDNLFIFANNTMIEGDGLPIQI